MRPGPSSAILLVVLLAGCAADPAPGGGPQTLTSSADAATSDPTSEPSMTTTATTTATTLSASASTSSSSSPTPSGTTKDADQLVLLAADMPASTLHPWSSGPPTSDPDNAAPGAKDYAEASVQRYSGTPRVVDTYVDVFPTSAQALDYYNDRKAELRGQVLTPVQAGDQAYRWTNAPGYQEEGWIVQQNVVWYLYIAGEGGTMSPTTETLMEKAAAKF